MKKIVPLCGSTDERLRDELKAWMQSKKSWANAELSEHDDLWVFAPPPVFILTKPTHVLESAVRPIAISSLVPAEADRLAVGRGRFRARRELLPLVLALPRVVREGLAAEDCRKIFALFFDIV